MQARAAADLGELVGAALDRGGPRATADQRRFATPRRLTLVVRGLAGQAARRRDRERRGPRVGAPARRLEGFLGVARRRATTRSRSRTTGRAGCTSPATRGVGKPTRRRAGAAAGRDPGALSVAQVDALGRPRDPLGPAAAQHPLPARRRGGAGRVRAAARPARSPTAIASSRPAPIEVRDFEDYRQKLAAAYVQLDGAERQQEIAAEADAAGARRAACACARIRRCWPSSPAWSSGRSRCSAGSTSASWRCRRRCWSPRCASTRNTWRSRTPDGRLAAALRVVANLPAEDGGRRSSPATSACCGRGSGTRSSSGTRIASGRSRAACRSSMASCSMRGLGSLGAKVARLAGAGRLARAARAGRAELEQARRAALLCKADLVTGMVGEFPELQGIMGRYYALHDAASTPSVAAAIAEHYAPQGPSDACPTAPVSVAVGLADKLDTLGRLLRDRREADRLEGPLRAAPRRARRDPADPREPAAPAAARGVPAGARGLRRAAARASTPMR